jgi:predicted permease
MELGFEPDGVMTASLDLEARGFTAERGTAFVRDLQDRLLASPGIEAANAVELVPLALSNRAQHFLRAGEAPPGPDANAATPLVYMNVVTPGHFGTLKIDLVAGRDFARVDDERAPRVAVVNQTLARMFWPGQSAIGQRIRPDGESGAWMEVVGIVKDSKYVTVGEDPKPFLYQPFAQAYSPHPVLLVRGSGPTASTVQTIRDVVRSLDPGLPVFDVMTLDTATAASLLPLKVAGRLLAILGVFALTLSVVGTYSVLSYLVRSRSRELAIRLAIGAPPKNLAWMVFRQALGATATGTAVGLAAAALVSGLLRSLLFGVSPYDGWTYTLVPLAIFCAAAVAAAVPARSATRQDPIAALRQV